MCERKISSQLRFTVGKDKHLNVSDSNVVTVLPENKSRYVGISPWLKQIKFTTGSCLKVIPPVTCHGHTATLFCHLKWLSTRMVKNKTI